jgi:large subunit ribosomal protein L17
MRHLKSGRKLGMPKSHRDSMLANLATSILDKERIITTLAKAKEARSVVERLITFGKKGGLNSIRHAGKTITDKTILHKLFTDIAPSFKDREGGYTRIIKLGERKGDNALLVIIELTDRGGEEIARLRKKQRKSALPGAPARVPSKMEKTPAGKAEKPVKTKAADKPKEEKPKAEKPKAEKPKTAKVKAAASEEGASGNAEGSPEKKVSAAPQAAPQAETHEEKTKTKKAPKAEAEKPKKAPKEKKK